MVAGDSAPARCGDGAEVVGRFAMSGEVVVPRAVGAALALLEFVPGQGVVGGVFAIPGYPAAGASSQSGVGPGRPAVGRDVLPVSSVSPCQFPPLVIFIHQLQKSSPCVGSDESLAYRLSPADVGELVDPELSPPLLRVSFEGLDFLEAKGQLALVGLEIAEADDVRLYPVISQVFYRPLHRSSHHPFFC